MGVAGPPPGSRPVETVDECFVVRAEEWRALNDLYELVKNGMWPGHSDVEAAVAAVERARQR